MGRCPRRGGIPPARRQLASLSAVAVLGGIGFTMALFIAGLAFPAGSPLAGLLDAAKVGILAASLLTSVAGALLLRRALGDTNEASS